LSLLRHDHHHHHRNLQPLLLQAQGQETQHAGNEDLDGLGMDPSVSNVPSPKNGLELNVGASPGAELASV